MTLYFVNTYDIRRAGEWAPYDAYVLLALQPRSSCIARWWLDGGLFMKRRQHYMYHCTYIKAMDPGKESTLQCLGFAPDQSYL